MSFEDRTTASLLGWIVKTCFCKSGDVFHPSVILVVPSVGVLSAGNKRQIIEGGLFPFLANSFSSVDDSVLGCSAT
jgi:hypothetical protein